MDLKTFFEFDKAIDIITEHSLEESINFIKGMDKLYSYKVTISPLKNDRIYSVIIRHSGFRQIPVSLQGHIEQLGNKQTRITGTASVSRSVMITYLLIFLGVTILFLFFNRNYGVLWLVLPIFTFIFIVQVGYAQEIMRDLIHQLDSIPLS